MQIYYKESPIINMRSSLPQMKQTFVPFYLSEQIADFGLSRDLANEDYYVSEGGKVPVKWEAPEALRYRKYSTASDVWSYGCVLYEIWSLGYKPFFDKTNHQVCKVQLSYYTSLKHALH